MVSYHVPVDASVKYVETLNDFIGIIQEVTERETGEYSVVISRSLARALANEGYWMNVSAPPSDEDKVFEVLTIAEFQLTGTFSAALSRSIAKALIAAGCSQ